MDISCFTNCILKGKDFYRLFSLAFKVLEVVVRRCSSKVFIGVVKNFAIFTGKQLRWSFFFNKIVGMKDCNFIKKTLQHRYFPMNIANFLQNGFFIEHLWWLLLKVLEDEPVEAIALNLCGLQQQPPGSILRKKLFHNIRIL